MSAAMLKRYSEKDDPVTLSGWQFTIGGVVMVFLGLLLGGRAETVSVTALLALIYLGFLSAAAYSLWGVLLKHNPVSKVTVFTCSTPIFGAILTMLLLPSESGNVNPINLIITLVLVSSGILLLNFKKQSS
jgi:drug/metabolite transporter (DMT)-like permease